MREIRLTQGQVAIVDDEDYEFLSKFKWHAVKHSKDRTFYAVRNSKPDAAGKRRLVYMHRFILGITIGVEVDHEDRNGLDNRRSNLRVMEAHGENMRNSAKQAKRATSSRFKGVSWNHRKRKWAAYVTLNRKRKFLGYFLEEEEAARAYDVAAKSLFGEFARLNLQAA